VLLKDYLIEKRILFKEDKEGFIHVLNLKGLANSLDWVEGIDYTLLKSVKVCFYCSWATEINLPNLKYVGGTFYCNRATEVNLPNLKYVGVNFYYEDATEINLPNLKYARGCSLDGK